MVRWFLHRYIRNFASRYDYDATYMHELADTSVTAFIRYAVMQLSGGTWRADAPAMALHAAGIAGALVEDCGPCVQIASDQAIEEGMPANVIAALLSAAPTDADAQLGFDYGRALLNASPNLDELRTEIAAKWGQRALVAMSLRAMCARNFPVLKRAMGHAKTCQRVRVGSAQVAVTPLVKAA